MREHPILFSGPMVYAILASRKTQTRRAINPTWWRCLDPDNAGDLAAAVDQCPYGQEGDVLWVREAWTHECDHCADAACGNIDHIWYRAKESQQVAQSMKWRPSIFMPRWASRLSLKITSVRIERVQSITDGDARREGFRGGSQTMGPRFEFADTWNEINAARGYAWDDNPWVWVIGFERKRP